jgi:predicted RNA-binding protein with PUA domain
MTNCKNCGAPLTNGKCDYCGTEYETITETIYSDSGIVLETTLTTEAFSEAIFRSRCTLNEMRQAFGFEKH